MSKNEPVVMTYSRISCFLNCPMKEYYQYRVEGVGIEGTEPFIPFLEGDLIHYALKYFHKSGRMLRVYMVKRAEKLIAEASGPNGLKPEVADALKVKLTAMVGAALAYKHQYHNDTLKYETLHVEEPFQYEL